MNEFWFSLVDWALRTAAAGGGVLLLGWLTLRFVTAPAIRHQIAAWTIRGAVLAGGLCLLPGWLTIPAPVLGSSISPMASANEPVEETILEAPLAPVQMPTESTTTWAESQPLSETTNPIVVRTELETPPAPGVTNPVEPLTFSEFLPLLLVPYFAIVAVLLLQLVAGHWALARLRGSSRAAPLRAHRVLAELAHSDDPHTELLLSDRLHSPICFGLFRWTILVPPGLASTASLPELRWVLAHELDHLRRGDPWTAVWAGVCRAFFFFVPWYWPLRRELVLSQEHLADAAAAAADGRVVDYAAFLVDLSGEPDSRPSRPLLAASAVRAGHTDLFRRVTMLLNSGGSLPRRCPRYWTMTAAAAVTLTAVVLSGLTWAAADEERPRPPAERRDGGPRPEGDGERPRGPRDGDAPRRDGEGAPRPGPRDGEGGPRPGGREGEVRRPPMAPPVNPMEIRRIVEQIEKAAEQGNQAEVRELVGQLQRMMQPRPPMGEGGPRFGPPEGKGPPRPGPRDGEGPPRVGPPEGKGPPRPGPRDGEGPPRPGPRDGDAPRPGPRDGEGPPRVGPRDGEGPPRPGPRDGDAPRPGPREGADARGERPPFPPPPPAIREAQKALESAMKRLENNPAAQAEIAKALEQYRRTMDLAERGPAPGGNPFARPQGAHLGAALAPVPAVLAAQLDLPRDTGLVVVEVFPDSPADHANVTANDVLLQIGDREVRGGVREVQEAVAQVKPGDSLKLVVYRKGKKETLTAKLPAPRGEDGGRRPNRERE